MKEFLGLSLKANGDLGFLRMPEGAWSWQHLLQVSVLMLLMVGLAIFFGKKNRNKTVVQQYALRRCSCNG